MSARSGMISDLASLVNEAKSAASGGSGGSGNNGSGGNNSNSERSSSSHYPPPPSSPRSSRSSANNSSSSSNSRANNSVADDASISSFSRSIARVARAAQGKDGGNSRSSGGRSSLLPTPPPPQSPRPTGPGSMASSARSGHNIGNPAAGNGNPASRTPSSQGSIASASKSSSSNRSSGRQSNRSGQSNATERLMNLVNELSQPKNSNMAAAASSDPSSSAMGSGYLPSQYTGGGGGGGGNNSNNSQRGGQGGYSRSTSRGSNNSSNRSTPSDASGRSLGNASRGNSSRTGSSIAANDGTVSGSLEPTGFVMPPGMGMMGGGGGGEGGGSSYDGGSILMPPGMGGNRNSHNGHISGGASSMYGSDTLAQSVGPSGGSGSMYPGGNDSYMSGSMMSATSSAGQSTMPTEYNNGGNYFNDGPHPPPPAALMNGPHPTTANNGGGGSSQGGEDSFASQPRSYSNNGGNGNGSPPNIMSSNASAPGGSFGGSNNGMLSANSGMDAPSVTSRSFMSTPLQGSNSNHSGGSGSGGRSNNPEEFMMNRGMGGGGGGGFGDSFASQPDMMMMSNNGNNGGGGNPPGIQYSQGVVPPGSQYSQGQTFFHDGQYSASSQGQQGSHYQYAGISQQQQQLIPGGQVMSYGNETSTLGSTGTRSLANSAAIIPRAKFSWAGESVGTQSTIMTGRHSLNSANAVPEPQPEREGNKVMAGRIWASIAWIITFPIPNKCIMRPTKDAKQAWREKVALFLMMVSCSVFFVGVFGFVPLLLCKEDTIFSMQDIWLQTGENWVVVHGVIYDVKDLIYRHPGGVKGIVDYLGKDGSKVFPRAPPVTLPQKCLDMEKVQGYNLDVYSPDNNFTNPTCASFSDLDVLLGVTCHTFAAGSNGTAKFLGDYERGMLSHTSVGLNELGISWLSIYDRVYDVTNYIKAINENREPVTDEEESNLDNNPAAYLTPTLNKVIMNSLQADATDLYEALFGSSEYIACLEEMFYTGLLDDEFDSFCYTLNIMMYVMLVFVATLMVIQFIASMIYICPRHHTYSEEDVMSPVMIMVPCYNEGDNELRKTIKSVLNTTYPDENKVLFMVGDGLVTGNGEDMSTPEHLANILGFDIDEFEDDTFEYDCIGVLHVKNRARVYHGILQKGHKFLKYIAVVKCGLPEEATTSAKPGNRGKRDSQLIIMGYYNRIHYGRELTELDSAVQRAMVDLNLQADMVRFLMAIDADTRVDTMSITHMVYGMDKKEKVLALCGETKVDNKGSSWVTMIQVFEYYNSHHLKKAFEAAFGCVTCLPGCFTMYRIIADDGTPLLPGDGVLYEYSRNDVETLHEKNLYHLGEDRMLTTLLLKYYPDRSLTFIPEATCWTIVPHTFRILLSQRRRWINSTVHNMFELLKVNTMCGVCCVSMKVVVFIDLIATMILPASYVYAMYLLFLVFFEDLPVSTVLLILYGIIMGVQIVVFILRSRWEYLWWFFIYFTIGLPIFYLVLPTYAFWNMDDFSWGKTRTVGGSAALNVAAQEVEDDDDDDDDEESHKLVSHKGYNLNTNDTSVPRAMQDADLRSTTSSSSSTSSGQNSSSDSDSDSESDYESGSEYSDSQAESEYFSHAASKAQGSGYRSAPS